MSEDIQPDRAPDQLNRTSAACHEPGDYHGILPFEHHTVGGVVGAVAECNLRRVLRW